MTVKGKTNIKILAMTRYSKLGASSRLRIGQYIDSLEHHNISIVLSPLFNDSYINRLYSGKNKSYVAVLRAYIGRVFALFSIFRYDVILIEKELFPNIPGLFEYLVHLSGKKYIVDYDDAIFHCYDQSDNLYMKLLSRKIDKVMKRSSMVICGNDYIFSRACIAKAPNIKILPTVVDTTRYQAFNRVGDSKIIIGWIGTPSTVHLLEIVRQSLEELNKTIDFVLHVIGAEFSSNVFKVKCINWSEDNEVQDIQNIDVGIMPLNDGLFERGKCGYKLIQYMACGKPVIASPVGVNNNIINESCAGFLATDEKWLEYLKILCANRKIRINYGSRARKYIEKKYSLEFSVPIMAGYLKEINRQRG